MHPALDKLNATVLQYEPITANTYNPGNTMPTESTAQAPALLTITDLSKRLQLHPSTTRQLYKSGRIPGLKLGHRTLRFDFAAVLDALRKAGDLAP